MKRAFCLIISIALLLSLCACGGPSKEELEEQRRAQELQRLEEEKRQSEQLVGEISLKLMDAARALDIKTLKSFYDSDSSEVLGSYFDVLPEKYLELLRTWSDKTSFELEESYLTAADKGVATLKVTYLNADDVLKQAGPEFQTRFASVFQKSGTMNEDDVADLFIECLKNSAEKNAPAEETLEIQIPFVLIDGEWKADVFTQEMLDIFFLKIERSRQVFSK